MMKKMKDIRTTLIAGAIITVMQWSSWLCAAQAGDIIITEFFYKSNGSVFEYIEFYNSTAADIDLLNWQVVIDDYSQTVSTSFPVNTKNYGVVTGLNGIFSDNSGANYLPANDPNWFGFTHTDLPSNYHWLNIQIPDDSGIIIIKDDSGNVIDSVNYSSELSYPTEDNYSGRSVEFLLDPSIASADSLNNLGTNWRAAEFQNLGKMVNKHGIVEQGTPGSLNFIPVVITAITPDKPDPDGYPGGIAKITLNAGGSGDGIIPIETYEWKSTGDSLSTAQLDSSTTAESFMYLRKDIYPEIDTFQVTLTVIDTSGIMGKKDTVIYVQEEVNENPKVHPDTVYYFENTEITLTGVVTDPELCNNSSTPCTADSLSFGTITNFTWEPPASVALTDPQKRVVSFTSASIESTSLVSANAHIDTLLFSLIAADPFGAADTGQVTVIIYNYNQIPTIQLDTTALAGVNIVSGLSLETAVLNNALIVYELDPSGNRVDSTIIGNIQDADNDVSFSTIPQGKQCTEGFENFYCVSDSLIKTKLNADYSQLSFPLIVSDDIHIPSQLISGDSDTVAYNLSTSSTIHIGQISVLHSEVLFAGIETIDGNFIIPEDTADVAF
ncbi:MAG: lamin tail domain-containing protein, partial [Candidatus Marinimicrobia bacterium]|nr:lamin tail domain-containing protein [Candidatus Neomarinimicrobiota bacterium]